MTLRTRAVALAVAVTLSLTGALTVAPTGATAATGVEDEGADCVVTGLPDAGSLPSNSRLPDPFKKLDGTRISAKSDWRCRREEIKKLAEKFVYNVAHNGTLAPGAGITSVGFQATRPNGNTALPSGYTCA
ncbi:hypothetical protein [Nonomuraea sp. NPDC048901]|uniref:hypothetical protein n=1 Tax=Nonomuraea sp. NPDC048901 TaxID=3155627 RepID=UPI0033F03814